MTTKHFCSLLAIVLSNEAALACHKQLTALGTVPIKVTM